MGITALNDYAIGDVNFNTMMTSLDKTFKGKAEISLSEYDTTAAPDVKAGSIFANNGTLFENTTDVTPTGYAGMTNSTTFYLYYDESASVFIYSNTAPTWSDALQGYYNGNDRAFFSMYKDSGGMLYENKVSLISQSSNKIFGSFTVSNGIDNGGTILKEKVVSGSASSLSITIPHGLTYTKIRGISGSIIHATNYITGVAVVDATNIRLNFAASFTGTAYAIIKYIL